MQEKLIIKKTEDTPAIILIPEKNFFKIIGNSFPENVEHFYLPLKNWVEKYVVNPNSHTTIEFKMDYLSSRSMKEISYLLHYIEKKLFNKSKLSIVWYYQKEDYEILNEGKRFESYLQIPFEFIAYQKSQTDLKINKTRQTPYILFSRKNNIFRISGNSIHIQAERFYQKTINWLETYKENPNESIDFIFRFDKINANSTKYVLKIIRILSNIFDKKSIKIKWYYKKNNNFIREIGEDFKDIINLNFEFIEYKL